MMMRKYRIFIIMTAVELCVLFVLILQNQVHLKERVAHEIPQKQELVKELELTDLAIWTEARYTRHPSQADFFSPFQDGPSALEHFPAGSVVVPPDRSGSSEGTGP